MKQQIIELKKKLLLVEIGGKLSDEFVRVIDEYGMAEILGKLTDITESQFVEWVDVNNNFSFAGDRIYKYKNYRLTGETYASYNLATAKESFFSYLESQRVVFENPLGEFPTKHNTGLEYGMEYLSKVSDWEEAQEKVFDINRCWIFEIL